MSAAAPASDPAPAQDASGPDYGAPGRPPGWHVAVLQAEAVLKREDDGFAHRARVDAQALLDGWRRDPSVKGRAPDPNLFALFEAAFEMWAARPDFEARDRLSGPLISLIGALTAIPAERRRRAERERGLPPSDR